MAASDLLPGAVLLPLGVASLLLALAHWLPPRASTVVAITTALGVALICAWLAHAALAGPILYWFGGWTPQSSPTPGVVLGISFRADAASAAVASFAGLLFAATLLFAWGYFDAVHSHFEVIMLMFLAAIAGFCLTHDLFNLFVWFELMSVAAFALTAYPLGKSSLEGAFNFTITNALASFFMLAGVGLLYARTGTLDFTEMGRSITRSGLDPATTGGFILIAAALMTKAAIVPFHLWLSDAHAVAPSPVSVIFSGIMVGLGLFALAKLLSQVFDLPAGQMDVIRTLLLWLGVLTALTGGLMAWAQRHLKRLLAFSTIAHLGIMLTAVATATPAATAGLIAYILGHGLIKGALFMTAGMLLARLHSVDEIALYGRGRQLWPAGLAMALGGILLGGWPIGLLHEATGILGETAPRLGVHAVVVIATALTGAAVLRSAARIFLARSGVPGPEMWAPTEREREKGDRPLWLMLLPCGLLLSLALAPGAALRAFLAEAVAGFSGGPRAAVLPTESLLSTLAPIALTVVFLGLSLLRLRPTSPAGRRLAGAERAGFNGLQFLHSGLVADYVAWMAVGLAAFAAVAWLG